MMVKCAIILFAECAVFAVQGQQKLKKVHFLCNSSPCAPARKRPTPFGVGLFLLWCKDLNIPNAICRWHIACPRLDGNNTLRFSHRENRYQVLVPFSQVFTIRRVRLHLYQSVDIYSIFNVLFLSGVRSFAICEFQKIIR